MATSSITKQFVVKDPKAVERLLEIMEETDCCQDNSIRKDEHMKEYEKVHTNSGFVNISGLADAIKSARLDCRLSRIKAGAYCGVSEITFLRWEQGATKNIKEDSYNKLVDILNGECCA